MIQKTDIRKILNLKEENSTVLDILRNLTYTHTSGIEFLPLSKLKKQKEVNLLDKWFSDKDVTEYLLPGTPLGLSSITGKLETLSIEEWISRLPKLNKAGWRIIHPEFGFIGIANLNAINMKEMSCERGIVIGEKKHWGKGIGGVVGEMLLEIAVKK